MKSRPTKASDAEASLPCLPDWQVPASPGRHLTPDEYLKFVQFCWDNLPDKDKVLASRCRQAPTVQFRV